MNVTAALEQLEDALMQWRRAREIVKNGWRTDSDLRACKRRLMDLDEAISVAGRFHHDERIAKVLDQAHRLMLGGAA